MSQLSITAAELDRWANDPNGPVALHLAERMVPVEGEGAPFFPPTYADVKGNYNIDTLADGTKVALVDSVGAQANRIEPIFKSEKYKSLIPQITIKHDQGEVSLLEAGHRLGDAVVRSTELAEEVEKAFKALLQQNDATALAKLGPTSLVFGVWDSRGTMAKVPRLLQSTVRAWNVSPLTRSAQYKPALDYAALEVFSAEDKEKGGAKEKNPLSIAGFLDVPATNTHGGIVAHGPIQRDLTINLVALRRLRGDRENELRQYILGLCLVAAAEPVDAFYRQGCLLVPHEHHPAVWTLVERNGSRVRTALHSSIAFEYAQQAAARYGVAAPRTVVFSKEKAKEVVDGKKDKGEAGEGKKGKKGGK